MTRIGLKTCVLSAFAAGVLAQSASATVIYSDSFNRTTGIGDGNTSPVAAGTGTSNWGSNDNALGGSSSFAWVTNPSGAVGTRTGGNQMVTSGSDGVLMQGIAYSTVNAAAASPDGFSVSFTFNRFQQSFNPVTPTTAAAGNGFISIFFGLDPASTFLNPSATPNTTVGTAPTANFGSADFALLFQQAAGTNTTGNTQFWEDGNPIAGTSGTATAGPNIGPINYNSQVANDVLLTFIPVVSGDYTGSINASLSLNGGPEFNFSLTGGDHFGHIGFSNNNTVRRTIDNLVVTAIPEPASILLAGLGGLAMLRRQRA